MGARLKRYDVEVYVLELAGRDLHDAVNRLVKRLAAVGLKGEVLRVQEPGSDGYFDIRPARHFDGTKRKREG